MFCPSQILLTVWDEFRIGVIVEKRIVDAVRDVSAPERPVRCSLRLVVDIHKPITETATLYR
jgi:hypothetical protein